MHIRLPRHINTFMFRASIHLKILFDRIDKFGQYILKPLLVRFPSWITPNRLSAARIPITIIIVILLTNGYESHYIMYLIFLAGLTDYLDGQLARVKGLTSEFGATLDRTIDKLFTIPLLTALIFTTIIGKFWITIAAIYALFDLISLYQTVDRLVKDIPTAASNVIGKLKFVLIFFFLLLSSYNYGWTYYWLLLPATVMSIWSMANHSHRELKQPSIHENKVA